MTPNSAPASGTDARDGGGVAPSSPAPPLRVALIDNYDSFTFNLVDYLVTLGAAVDVVRNDAVSAAALRRAGHDAVVLSPGPGRPEDAGISLDLIALCAEGSVPLLGVCLGHQAIALAFGGTVARAGLMHGKTSPVRHDGSGVFARLPSPFAAARYHSLAIVDPGPVLAVNAWSGLSTGDDAAVIMGVRHPVLPIHGVQFHPESIASAHGHALLGNFLALARAQLAKESRR